MKHCFIHKDCETEQVCLSPASCYIKLSRLNRCDYTPIYYIGSIGIIINSMTLLSLKIHSLDHIYKMLVSSSIIHAPPNFPFSIRIYKTIIKSPYTSIRKFFDNNFVVYIFGGNLGTLSNVFQRGFKTLTLKTFFLNTLIDNVFHTDSIVMRQLGKLKGSDIRF